MYIQKGVQIFTKHLISNKISGVTGGGGGQGGRLPPYTSDREISADLPGKERQGKKGKCRKKKENLKREGRKGGKLKMEGGKVTK